MSVDAARHRGLTVPSGADPLLTTARKTVAAGTTAASCHAHYLSRLADFRQMDIQSALDQMKTLLSTRPHVVYKTAYYRKQTKNHWARDDPAFVALQFIFLVISCIAYAISFRAPFMEGVAFLLYSVLFNWLGAGLIVASLGREVANRHLTDHKSNSHVRQSVEWLYAFDIHCNAFFPVFVLLYGVQFFLLPLVLGTSLVALLLSNTLYAAALAWYWYITHLGYRALPFLSQTEVFLFPIAAVALVYVLNLVGYPFGLGWNASRLLAHLYFD
ncbi:UNC-50 family protein [Nitzschia inconspicua]|uniref:UNC-50 family protein n=1 Tax=Nitzschia inconspicua TaxID=303405 RepID=A0A9K3KU30_9STRA|nr:UNC-50 family protein [Nitzschia inconspicua]